MKTKLISFLFLFLFALISCQKNDNVDEINNPDKLPETVMDYGFDVIESVYNRRVYFKTNDPLGALTNEKATLGRVLFYDKKLSLNNSISCASCHQQTKGFADGKQFSPGLNDEMTSRNSMTVLNAGFQGNLFWDARAKDLREQVMMPIENHIEMGIESLDFLIEKLEKVDYYQPLFDAAFGVGGQITEDKISIALAQFLGAMVTPDSKYDKGLENDFQNFTQKEANGKELFFERLSCDGCHRQPIFASSWQKSNIGLDSHYSDEGAGNGRFKVPSLRNIEFTAPYMHDGRYQTLEEVIDHYSNGIKDNPNLDWDLRDNSGQVIRHNLNDTEKKELIAFLKTLTDHSLMTDERFSSPF